MKLATLLFTIPLVLVLCANSQCTLGTDDDDDDKAMQQEEASGAETH
jgi:hypothetical protein